MSRLASLASGVRATLPALVTVVLVSCLTAPSPAEAQPRERRNFHGMHNLMDGGASIPEGLNWTRHMVGEGGYVFDWVRGDYGKWVVEAMDRGLIPCLRLQECNGGCTPNPGYQETVAGIIREHLERHRPEYLNRIIYIQPWNEPGDPRDYVTPEDFADYLVAAHAGLRRADVNEVIRVMTPGQNGSEWWRTAIRHNPGVCQAFDVWATHPYPESYPPHYNHHDGVPYINQVKTIDSYLLDLDVVADECEKQGSPRRGFPVMITETAYGDHLGIAYEGYPKTTRGAPCSTDGPCDYGMASQYNVAAFGEFWKSWPEIVAVHPFILNNWAWDHFAFVSRGSGSRDDQPVPGWCPPEDVAAGVSWPPGYSEGAQRCGMPTAPYPQYTALLDLNKAPPSSLEPYRGPVGSLRGIVRRADTGEPVKHATVFTDGRGFGGPSLFDGQYAVHDVPVGTYTLSVEKVGYGPASAPIVVQEGVETVVDFDLPYRGKVSRGIYFQNQGTCSGCDLFAPFLAQTFTAPPEVGFIKFAAAMPNVGNVTMRFSILEGGPTGPQIGPSVTAYLEWGGEMIGAEWPGDGVPVEPGGTYALRIERDDGPGVYLYATDANPYPEGMAYTGTTARPGWDLLATVRGRTTAVDTAVGTMAGVVEDASGLPLAGAGVTAEPGGHTTVSAADGRYVLAALAEGLYQVSATLAGYVPQTASGVAVFSNQTTTVNLVLEPDVSHGRLVGTVRAENADPLSGATLRALPGGHATTTDAAGQYVFDRLAPDTYAVSVSRDGFAPREETVVIAGGETTTLNVILTALPPPPPPTTLIANGDFSRGLTAWSSWRERGDLLPVVNGSGQLHLTAAGHNGGVYQTFSTGGTGTEITIDGFWASGPTAPQAQWAEVLVINGPGTPMDGQDLNAGQPNVVLVFKNDTWATPTGWTGDIRSTAPVHASGSFVAAGDTATIVLKSGNLLGVTSGTLFDDVVVRGSATPPPPVNQPPVARVSANPTSGVAPLAVLFDGSGSSDPDGDTLSHAWDFGDGASGSGATTSHTYASPGSFNATLTVDDGRGGTDATTVAITVTAPSVPSLLVNGDFSQGLTGWSSWRERGDLNPVVNGSGQLHLTAVGHNGGVYQTFSTGGTGTEITIDGFWASAPTAPQAQWAEVLVINGPGTPVDGQDLNAGQPNVVLVYKNDTWATPAGWSGDIRPTAPVQATGSFVAAGDTATIVLKSGNLLGVSSGTLFDDVVVRGSATPPPPVNLPPVARATASPTSGVAPLAVLFDGSGSSDPDGDTLSYAWDFGDGASGSGASISHTYASPGSFVATLTVDDGRGATDDTGVTVVVSPAAPPPGSVQWDSRLTQLGLQVVEADVAPGGWYWQLVSGVFESDGEILPPPGGGSESQGTHSVYVRALGADGNPVENQEAVVAWPNGSPTSQVSIWTKGAVDGYWGDFPMAGGSWCPFFPDGPRGPYGAAMAGAASDEVWGMGMPCNRHVSFRFVWRWTQRPATSTGSKLTIHTGFGGPLSMQFVEHARPGLVKILDSFSGAPEVKRLSPETEIIGRAYLASQPMDGDPVQRAREWWDRTRSLVLQNPAIDYWEGYNEPIIQTVELMSWYARFEAERVRLLAENGKRACIGNFSVGNPDLPLWPAFYPAIDAALAHGGILGLHEYGTPMQQYFDEAAGEGWLAGRYRKVYRQYLIPSGRPIRLAITECGVDVVAPVGWRNHFTEEEYLTQLQWYDHLIREDDYVIGATIFALEIPGWWSFDIAPIVDRLADYVAAEAPTP